jgi:two-component system, response regulator PdtaR
MRVLIIEDEPIIALELERIVEDAGYVPVGPASTLEQALAFAPRADIALVDLGLSDGSSGAALGRRLMDRFHIKVIFVTGNPSEVGHGLSGSTEIISKPFTDARVRESLKKAASLIRRPVEQSLPG